jgi:predicted  nucleic acid-binding Zn-ribbon protein
MELKTKRMANQIMQMENTVDGMIDRINKLEELLSDIEKSRPVVYINEDTALISSNEADIRWVKGKVENELSDLRNEQLLQGDTQCQ